MNRRAFIAIAAVTPLAGCTGLFGGGVDTTLEDGEFAEFTADEGAELSVMIEVQELIDPQGDNGEDVDIERDDLTVRISHEESGPIDARGVADTKSYEVTVEEDGTHDILVIGGTADVLIE